MIPIKAKLNINPQDRLETNSLGFVETVKDEGGVFDGYIHAFIHAEAGLNAVFVFDTGEIRYVLIDFLDIDMEDYNIVRKKQICQS